MPKHKVFKDSDSDEEHAEDVESSDEDSLVPKDDVVEEESTDADSDAEPEAVTFVDSRKNVLDRVRTAIRQIERDRQQLKAKRQKKDTVYKEQKRLKLEKLTRLPEDVLEAVSSNSSREQKQRNVRTKPSKPAAVDTENEEAKATDDNNIGTKNTNSEAEDYIPLDSNAGIKAVTVNQLSKATSTTQSAIEFRRQRSHNPQIRRESASSFMAKSIKRKVMKAS